MTHSPPQWRTVAEFWVPGRPARQPRPLCRAIPKRMPNGSVKWIGQMYEPDHSSKGTRTKDEAFLRLFEWRRSIIRAAQPHIPREPLRGSLWVDDVFFIPRPAYMLERKYPDRPFPCDAHAAGDRDNLDKPILDALTKAGMWKDDCQVSHGAAVKLWAAKGGASGCMVTIRVLREAAVQQVFFQPLENTK